MTSHIKIKHDWQHVRDTVIELDDLGNIAKQITTVEIDMAGGRPPRVKLGLHLPVLDFEGEAQVRTVVTAEQARFLSNLGWIPPAEIFVE